MLSHTAREQQGRAAARSDGGITRGSSPGSLSPLSALPGPEAHLPQGTIAAVAVRHSVGVYLKQLHCFTKIISIP
ncbi:hypothetical protein NDU88_004431 [Pleurodeles waltl]|uniref:Uncharacterized protein n=1 Tax=Pleurodeles waltl TaxID=8319 RepID=A0AAV7SIX4_PLEWA|nr:hypothetical protein NDU88_004431 [Pleurodeles waltl]